MANPDNRDTSINLRVRRRQRALIDKAASLSNKNRTDFMLEASCKAAEDVLLNQRLFLLEQPDFEAFNDILNSALDDNPKLKALLSSTTPWDKK